MIRKKILVLFIVLVTVSFVGLYSNQMLNSNEQVKPTVSLHTSQLTELPYVIRVDNNWTETVAAYDWCTGLGTELDPYVIQGINISIGDRGPSIAIEDSVEHFVIRNCSFYNVIFDGNTASRFLSYYAGVYIGKAEYGLIENCTFNNNFIGISIEDAELVDITNCRIIGSYNDSETGFGFSVYVDKGERVSIVNNSLINYYSGLIIRNSEFCTVENNYIENLLLGVPDANGVYFDSVNSSAITNNEFVGCVAISQLSDVTISGLSIAGFGDSSIIVNPNCHDIRVYGNRFYDMDGNLIADDSSIPAFDIPIILGIVVSIAIIGILWRKKKIS